MAEKQLMPRPEAVKNYLHRLGLNDHELNLPFLNELVKRHVATFAFSSLGCQLGDELPLDFNSLFQRIVVQRRGGYCFEQNALLFEILQELGFEAELYLARVIYNQNTYPALTHRITVVKHESESYVLDVGFGPLGPRTAIPMSSTECSDGYQRFRVKENHAGEYHVQVFKDSDFFSLYRFELARYGLADCEMGHFYSHRHPTAAFVNHLVVSRLLENETRSLRDLTYRVITKSNNKEQKINSAEQLKNRLIEALGIRITASESKQLFDKLKQKNGL